jgi:hypothetical protein
MVGCFLPQNNDSNVKIFRILIIHQMFDFIYKLENKMDEISWILFGQFMIMKKIYKGFGN